MIVFGRPIYSPQMTVTKYIFCYLLIYIRNQKSFVLIDKLSNG